MEIWRYGDINMNEINIDDNKELVIDKKMNSFGFSTKDERENLVEV